MAQKLRKLTEQTCRQEFQRQHHILPGNSTHVCNFNSMSEDTKIFKRK